MTKDTATSAAAVQAQAAPDYPGKALEAAIAAATRANPVITGPDDTQYALVPPGFQKVELTDDTRLAPWPQARIIVDDQASMIKYVNRFSTPRSVLMADFNSLAITARLDWHADNTEQVMTRSQIITRSQTGPDEHSVTLKLLPSEEFTRWDKMQGKQHAQADFARFLEENAVDILHPDAASMIELSRDFEATQSNSYKSAVRLDNGDRALTFQSETNAQSRIVIPQKFTLSIPVYNGEAPDELTALFRWRPSSGTGVTLGFEWHRVEYQRRAHFAAIAHAVAEDTGLPVIMGRT